MRLRLLYTLVFGLLIFSAEGNAQTTKKLKTQPVQYQKNVEAPLTANELSMLREVYQDQLQKYVLSNPARVKGFKHLLRNRLDIKKMPGLIKEEGKYTLLSEVELFNSYNANLKRDTKFDINTFNPLKYNLEFFRMGSVMYRIDNTDYFIVIESQNFKQ